MATRREPLRVTADGGMYSMQVWNKQDKRMVFGLDEAIEYETRHNTGKYFVITDSSGKVLHDSRKHPDRIEFDVDPKQFQACMDNEYAPTVNLIADLLVDKHPHLRHSKIIEFMTGWAERRIEVIESEVLKAFPIHVNRSPLKGLKPHERPDFPL